MKKIDLNGIKATRRTGNSHKCDSKGLDGGSINLKRNKTGSMVMIYQKIYTNRI